MSAERSSVLLLFIILSLLYAESGASLDREGKQITLDNHNLFRARNYRSQLVRKGSGGVINLLKLRI